MHQPEGGERKKKFIVLTIMSHYIEKLITSKCSPWLVLPVAPSSAPVVSSPRLSSGSIPPPKPQLSSDRIFCYCHLNMLILMERSADRAFYSQPFSRNYSTTCTSESCPNYVSVFLRQIWKNLSTSASVAPLPLKSLISWRYRPPSRNSMMSRISLGWAISFLSNFFFQVMIGKLIILYPFFY